MRYLLILLTIFSFVNSAFAELDEALHHADEKIETLAHDNHSHDQDSIEEVHHCSSKDCHEESHASEHCQNFCSGLHNLTQIHYQISIHMPQAMKIVRLWQFENHYLMPSLDPGLRPPIQS
ncbi:hypothetical protein [Bacteriovorax sp. DB6_IX]|uniref:hypothetical protein n=1 Tax=Bacteriovorax sp. DB6_IX TaxID=1353530 RepID=UPI000389F18B|nr:hypothetical protein [Bacteriovorax sp. DB6_IX]EQC49263.1 hypothetical protein M901_2782 [Bacteriovorax sp. DB6_IX]